MGWTLTDDLEAFLTHAGDFLRADPVINTVPLTVTHALRAHPSDTPALFGWWTTAGQVNATLLWTSDHPPLLSSMPTQAARDLADALTRRGRPVPGVNATREVAEAFTKTWTNTTGADSHVAIRERLYRLGQLVVPESLPEGAMRIAGDADHDLLLELYTGFSQDTQNHVEVSRTAIEARLASDGLMLWEVDGRPVAMAGRTPLIAGMTRVAPVYTPRQFRGRGYGTAITAAVTRTALEAGAAHVVLFTDLDNPTSNGIYQRLGYRPVEDRVVTLFT